MVWVRRSAGPRSTITSSAQRYKLHSRVSGKPGVVARELAEPAIDKPANHQPEHQYAPPKDEQSPIPLSNG